MQGVAQLTKELVAGVAELRCVRREEEQGMVVAEGVLSAVEDMQLRTFYIDLDAVWWCDCGVFQQSVERDGADRELTLVSDSPLCGVVGFPESHLAVTVGDRSRNDGDRVDGVELEVTM